MLNSREMLASKERKLTDVPAIFVCIGFVGILFGFVGYAFANGNIFRTINGIDDCGNICGRDNPGLTIDSCGPHDKRSERFTLVIITRSTVNPNITYTNSKCVKNCADYPGYVEIANRCLLVEPNETASDEEIVSFLQQAMQDLSRTWYHILATCMVALIFSYILLILFRYAIKYIIWFIYISLVVFAFALGIFLLVTYFIQKKEAKTTEDEQQLTGLLWGSGFSFLFGIVLAIVLFFMRKRVRLVIQLFKEASKALIDVPAITIEPILSFLALALTWSGFFYFTMVCYSSGNLKTIKMQDGSFYKAEYVQNAGMVMGSVLNVIAFIWFTSFIFDCQNFVIAGTVSQWFFARSKDKLDSPVMRAFKYLMRFHIGSICLGSILITIFQIIKTIIDTIMKSLRSSQNPFVKCLAMCCKCIMNALEEFLQYLMRNAYIVVAMDGTPLFTSGKKAFRLLKNNFSSVVTLNKMGDFILSLGKVFVVAISGFVCYEMVGKSKEISHPWVPILISCIFAYLIVDCFITVYEMTIDTIFICYCEDCEENDGETRPYFMSKDLMEVMRELKSAAGAQSVLGGRNVEAGNVRPPPVKGFR